MATMIIRSLVCAWLTSLLVLPDLAADPTEKTQTANYMFAIRQECARLNLNANCNDATRTCVYKQTIPPDGPRFDIVIRHSVKTRTIYIYIDRFVQLADPGGPSLTLARRLLELNREMVTAKLEWDRSSESIRLSVVVNTDSNFDRRAFRSQLVGLWANAQKLLPELSLHASPKGSAAPTAKEEVDLRPD